MASEAAQAQRRVAPATTTSARSHSSSTLTLLAFAAVYFIWGSTFFAIRIAVGSIPALLVPAMRHLSVGLVFYPLFRFRKEKPTLTQWVTCAVTGCLLLTIGNGTVSWAEKFVPSGIAALLVATVSLWMVLLDWLRPGGARPSPRVFAGIVLGFAGLALLVGPGHSSGGSDRVSPFGALILVIASLAWAYGSIYSRHHPLPNSPLLGVAMQCLAGGGALLIATIFSGELKGFHWAQVSFRSWIAIFYLAIFGSAIGYSAYVYLLKHSSATSVSTYAFVNPVVALLIGWAFGGETLSLRTLLASAVILSAVILVITARRQAPVLADETLPVPGEA
jgi:drug/metabolite transporter (DMT)-like permease